MEGRLEKLEEDIKELKEDVKDLKKEDTQLKKAIQDLKESIILLNTNLSNITGIGKWLLGIAGGILVTVIGAIIIALLKQI